MRTLIALELAAAVLMSYVATQSMTGSQILKILYENLKMRPGAAVLMGV